MKEALVVNENDSSTVSGASNDSQLIVASVHREFKRIRLDFESHQEYMF